MSVLTTLAIRRPEHRAALTAAFAVLARASRRITDGALDNTVLQGLSAEGTAPRRVPAPGADTTCAPTGTR
ncbi:hypothetical protein MOV08_42250 [Streptomyces yunnanensis]|uniref:Uncharacterized protein n=1 Tax=Streptomyces yunnanensis TaxID=156453 RepID=A0ABY8AKX8_9ACTN|nr:hypothetical protein [Streptomyces yunnanensis]WEB45271.1 hypothetical protein MOV08_42250 [Streptomyces yunnanensis]